MSTPVCSNLLAGLAHSKHETTGLLTDFPDNAQLMLSSGSALQL